MLCSKDGYFFVDEYLSALDVVSNFTQSIFIQTLVFFKQVPTYIFFIKRFQFTTFANKPIFNPKISMCFQLCLISPVVQSPTETPIHWGLIDNNSIFNIIAWIAHNSYTGILSCW